MQTNSNATDCNARKAKNKIAVQSYFRTMRKSTDLCKKKSSQIIFFWIKSGLLSLGLTPVLMLNYYFKEVQPGLSAISVHWCTEAAQH